MAKYTFSQGKVAVEEGVYVPLVRRDRRLVRTGMLIIIPPQPPAEGHPESTLKENAHDER